MKVDMGILTVKCEHFSEVKLCVMRIRSKELVITTLCKEPHAKPLRNKTICDDCEIVLSGLTLGINHEANRAEVGDLLASYNVPENQIKLTSENSNPFDLLEKAAKAVFSVDHTVTLTRNQ